MGHDERELIGRSRRGDLDAFEALVVAGQDRIYGLCLRITGNSEDAADAAQEAFVRAFQSLARFEGRAAFSTWLYRIAANAATDLVRRRAADPPLDLAEDCPASTDTESEFDRRELWRRVHSALARLPLEFRVAVVLRDMQGLAYEEIASILQVPKGTVRSRLSRGRLALRELIGEIAG